MNKHLRLRSPGRPHGFSLVEGVMGILILSFVMLALTHLYFDTGLPFIERARDYAIAVNICERFLNAAKAKILTLPADQLPDLVNQDPDVTDELRSSPNMQESLKSAENIHSYKVTEVIEAVSQRQYKVSLTMSWARSPTASPTQSVVLATLVNSPEYESY